MRSRYTRRGFLCTGAAAGVAGLAGCNTKSNPGQQKKKKTTDGNPSFVDMPTTNDPVDDPPVNVRGAIYLPARAHNVYQMWWRYDRNVIERDLGYAAKVNLNAIRIWLNYEWWREDRKAHEKSLEHFLNTADENGMRVLVGLFEGVGYDATREDLRNTDVDTAVPVASPARDIMRHVSAWDGPREFVRWFMDKYGDDERILAISVMNEPGWDETEHVFSKAMFKTMAENRGKLPLTVGSTGIANNADYVDWGSDVLQFHYNFPQYASTLRNLLGDAQQLQQALESPVWLTEWQRVRNSSAGFASGIEGNEWAPGYSTLAPVIKQSGIGNFFWSLMIKPAYVPAQKKLGTVTGLFHEDGAVWSQSDAAAIKAMSGETGYEGPERPHAPKWMGEGYGRSEVNDNDDDEERLRRRP